MKNKTILTPLLLPVPWLLAVAGAILLVFRPSMLVQFVVGISGFVYIVALIWALSREKPSSADLPDLAEPSARPVGFWLRAGIIFLGLGLAFLVGMMIGTGLILMLFCGVIGLVITLRSRKQVTRRWMVLGLASGLLSALGIIFLGNGDISWAVVNLITVPPIFIAGVLLVKNTGFGRVRLADGQMGLALKGFVWGCIFAIPASLLNLLGNMQGQDTWIIHWYQPLYAIVPGITEETWARLFLITFCYAVLRPATNRRPLRAVAAGILVSMLAHGFSHTGIDPFGILIGTVLYTLPDALFFMKTDFEHAAGYHFMIDFMRFTAAFLANLA